PNPLSHRPRLPQRQPRDSLLDRTSFQRLVDIAWNHLELQPNPTQKLSASRGSRRQYQSHGSRRGAGGGAGGAGWDLCRQRWPRTTHMVFMPPGDSSQISPRTPAKPYAEAPGVAGLEPPTSITPPSAGAAGGELARR